MKDLDAALLRVARRMLAHRARTVGLVPVGDPDLSAVAPRLAAQTAVLLGTPVATLDPWSCWAAPAEAAAPAVTRAVTGPVVQLTLAPEPDPVAAPRALAAAIDWARARFGAVLADLTGLPPESALLLAVLDAVVPVATAGAAREDELRSLGARLADRTPGVLLIG